MKDFEVNHLEVLYLFILFCLLPQIHVISSNLTVFPFLFQMKLYQIVGRKAPNPADLNPGAYRMKLFAPNEVVAKSRFWYFMHQMRKMKKTTGEILDCNEIVEKNQRYVKNYGIWIKYSSRSGTHNMYREYRDITLNGAIDSMYNDMAGRHRARFASIQIIKTATVADEDTKRVGVQQFHETVTKDSVTGDIISKNKIKFPLPHRILRASSKSFKNTFSCLRPGTFFK